MHRDSGGIVCWGGGVEVVSCGLRMKGLVVQRWRGISAECRILRGVVGVGSVLDGCALGFRDWGVLSWGWRSVQASKGGGEGGVGP